MPVESLTPGVTGRLTSPQFPDFRGHGAAGALPSSVPSLCISGDFVFGESLRLSGWHSPC